MEGFMRCIPSFAVMNTTDRERAVAQGQLVAFLKETDPSWDDPGPEAAENALTYLCSIPYRQDDGAIRFAHLFQRDDPFGTKPEYFHVTASPEWWPQGCRSLPPQQRTSGRAPLRLVS
jgi:hypothetical protein